MQINSMSFGCKHCEEIKHLLQEKGTTSQENIQKWTRWQTVGVEHENLAKDLKESLQSDDEYASRVARSLDRLKYEQNRRPL